MRKDREPLRIPDNWRGQDRQFVIQLERVLDYMSWSIIPETYDWDAITNKPANYPGGCTGNAATATKVIDAGDSSKSLSIRYTGDGASATDWIPFYDSNGNLVPVSSTNLAGKVQAKASGSWGISVTGTAGGVAWGNVSSKPTDYPGGCTGNAATSSKVLDIGDTSKQTTFAYSKAGLAYGDYTWLAGWNGYELRAVAKSQFAQASHTHSYLPLSGGTLTGNLTLSGSGRAIAYTGTKATYNMIKFVDNTSDTYGNGISIGGGGLVIVGAGESSDAIASGKSGGEETLYLGGDGNVYIMSNVQNGVASAKTYTFDTSGNLILPSGSRVGGSGGALYLGNSGNQSWVYVQDMCSQSDANNWKITQAGRGTFKELYLGSQDMGAAVKSISRSGNTFTATQCNGSTFTFTQTDTLPSSSSSSATGYGVTCYVYKYGNVVSFILPAQNVNAAVSKGSTMLTFPSGYRPPRECCFMGASGGWASYNIYKVTSGGALIPSSNAISSGAAVAVCGSFIV